MALRKRSFLAFLLVLAATLSAAVPAAAAVVYDSGGFEPTRFIPGELSGQDTQGPWLKDTGTSVALVQSAIVQSGVQAVQFTRTPTAAGDTRYGVIKPLTPTPPLQLLRVSWDMNVTRTQSPGVEFGPFFGVEGYDGFGAAPKLIGSLGVDATTGEVLIQDAAQGGAFVAPGATVPFAQWNQFAIEFDYTTQTYTAFVNGAEVGGSDFVDEGVVGFTDAPMSALAASGGAGLLAPGVAYFDNYRIDIVPEPTSAAIIGLASIGLMRRRRAAC